MIIEFECSGGYANLRLHYKANVDELPPETGAALRDLVAKSGIMDLNATDLVPKSPGPPDIMRYRIDISHAGAVQSLEMSEITVPPSLRPLLARLQELATGQEPH